MTAVDQTGGNHERAADYKIGKFPYKASGGRLEEKLYQDLYCFDHNSGHRPHGKGAYQYRNFGNIKAVEAWRDEWKRHFKKHQHSRQSTKHSHQYNLFRFQFHFQILLF